MVKDVNLFSVGGTLIGMLVAVLFSQVSNTIVQHSQTEELIVLACLCFIFGILGLSIGQSIAASIKQAAVVRTVLVEKLTHAPQIHVITSLLEKGEIEVSHQGELERYEYFFNQDGEKKLGTVRSDRVIKSDRQDILLEIIEWEFKYSWHRFIQELKPTEYVFRVPHNIDL
jgi:hypothetical protein